MSYELFVALELNTALEETRRANVHAAGHSAATSHANLDPIWGDALAISPEEARRILWEANAARTDARVKRKMGWE